MDDTSRHDEVSGAPHAGHPDHRDLGFSLPPPAKLSRTRGLAIGAIVLAVAAAAFIFGYLPKHRAHEQLADETKSTGSALPRVEVVAPKPVTSDHALVLAGNFQALEETVIYPRADGYVKRWLVDIGDVVTEGQLLAEIDTPEVDKELAQGRAQLLQAQAAIKQVQANRVLSKTTLERYQKLAADKLVAETDLDTKKAQALTDEANVSAAEANVAAQKANVERLEQLVTFTKVTAPFGGTITERDIQRGALVTGTTPLFKLSATDPLRVFVQVPQEVAAAVHADLPAVVTVREHPEHPYDGKVARAAGALDPVLRTMNTEVRVPNPKHELLPGMYATVAVTLPAPHRLFEVPATAIFNDSRGVRVAVVDAGGKIAFVPVTIERDTGAAIQISTGLKGDERVVKLSSASLIEGEAVDAVVPVAPTTQPAKTPPAK